MGITFDCNQIGNCVASHLIRLAYISGRLLSDGENAFLMEKTLSGTFIRHVDFSVPQTVPVVTAVMC